MSYRGGLQNHGTRVLDGWCLHVDDYGATTNPDQKHNQVSNLQPVESKGTKANLQAELCKVKNCQALIQGIKRCV